MNFLLTLEALAQILPAVASLVQTVEQAFPNHSQAQKVDHVLNTVQAAVGAAQVADVTYEQLKPVLAATVASVVQANAVNQIHAAPAAPAAPAPAEVAPVAASFPRPAAAEPVAAASGA